MFISRLLVLSLLISSCVAAAAAQKPSDNIPGSFYSQPPGPLPQHEQVNLRLIPIQRPIDVDRLYSPYAKRKAARAGEDDWSIKWLSPSDKRVLVTNADPNDATCYSMRSYRVTRDDPESDSTRPAGYSTCQPATKFQVKEANDRQQIVPR
jgi:hypothetical protein